MLNIRFAFGAALIPEEKCFDAGRDFLWIPKVNDLFRWELFDFGYEANQDWDSLPKTENRFYLSIFNALNISEGAPVKKYSLCYGSDCWCPCERPRVVERTTIKTRPLKPAKAWANSRASKQITVISRVFVCPMTMKHRIKGNFWSKEMVYALHDQCHRHSWGNPTSMFLLMPPKNQSWWWRSRRRRSKSIADTISIEWKLPG